MLYKYVIQRIGMIMFFVFSMGVLMPFRVEGTSFMEVEKVDWEKIYMLVKSDKLPYLDKTEEEEIISEVDRILKEKKSVYRAIEYLHHKVGNLGIYILYGNPKIKETVVKVMKTKIQCCAKESLSCYDKKIEKLKREEQNMDIEKKEEFMKKLEIDRESIRVLLNNLISKDGDLCLECYINDEEERKELIPPSGQEKEFESEGFYWTLESFFSIALSIFSDDIYDYLWQSWEFGSCCNDMPIYPKGMVIAKLYPEQFLKDIILGSKVYGDKRYREFVYRERGGCIDKGELFFIISNIVKYNKRFTGEHKEDIKLALNKYASRYGEYCCILGVYEEIGEKEDIEYLKELNQKIMMVYPMNEIDLVDEKIRGKYQNNIKQFRERVNALVEKLSSQ